MYLFSIVARSAIVLDPGVGLSITSLLGSLGAAGAALTITHYFLGFLKNQGNNQARIVSEFKDYHAESQRKFQDHLDRLSNRQQESQRRFQSQLGQMSESQNTILRDAIVAMRRMEDTIDGSAATIISMQESVGSLRLTVGAFDMQLRDNPRTD